MRGQVQVRLRARLQRDVVHILRRLHHVSPLSQPPPPPNVYNHHLVCAAQRAAGLQWAPPCASPPRTATTRCSRRTGPQQVHARDHRCLTPQAFNAEAVVHGSGSMVGAAGDRQAAKETCPAAMMHIPYKCVCLRAASSSFYPLARSILILLPTHSHPGPLPFPANTSNANFAAASSFLKFSSRLANRLTASRNSAVSYCPPLSLLSCDPPLQLRPAAASV